MNRKQKRKQSRIVKMSTKQIGEIIKEQESTPERCRESALDRLQLNLIQAGHPFHHRTASGVIVEPDPTLEHYLLLLTEGERDGLREEWIKKASPDAPKAVPVDRTFYGFDRYPGEHK